MTVTYGMSSFIFRSTATSDGIFLFKRVKFNPPFSSKHYVEFLLPNYWYHCTLLFQMQSKGQKIHQSTLDKMLKNENKESVSKPPPRIVMTASSEDENVPEFYELDKSRLKVTD